MVIARSRESAIPVAIVAGRIMSSVDEAVRTWDLTQVAGSPERAKADVGALLERVGVSIGSWAAALPDGISRSE